MDINFKLSDKDKKRVKNSVAASLMVGAGNGIATRELMKHGLGLSDKVDPHSLIPFSNSMKYKEAVEEASKAGKSASEALSKIKMSPERLKDLDKVTLASGAAGALGTLAALSLMHGFDKVKKSYDKKAAEDYNIQSAKNLALREAGFPSEDEVHYEKQVVPVTKR